MITELTRQRLSDSHMGHKRSVESIEKQRQKLLGRKRKPFTLTHKANIKKSRASQVCPPCSDEKKKKISLANKGKTYSPKTIFKKGDDFRRNIYKFTSIEVKIKKELESRGFFPECHQYVIGINVDFLFREKMIVIECDGDYWHNLPGVPENDTQKTFCLNKAGYKVFRFWEHEINRSPSECVDSLAFHLK